MNGHWGCWVKMVLGKVLWVASALSLLLAWVAVYRRGLVFNLEPLAWYWNALILGVLAVGAKVEGSCYDVCSSEEKQ